MRREGIGQKGWGEKREGEHKLRAEKGVLDGEKKREGTK